MTLNQEKQRIVSELEEWLEVTGAISKRSSCYYELKSMFTESLDTLHAAVVREVGEKIDSILKVSFLPAIPESDDYAEGWNDCRRLARERRDALLKSLIPNKDKEE